MKLVTVVTELPVSFACQQLILLVDYNISNSVKVPICKRGGNFKTIVRKSGRVHWEVLLWKLQNRNTTVLTFISHKGQNLNRVSTWLFFVICLWSPKNMMTGDTFHLNSSLYTWQKNVSRNGEKESCIVNYFHVCLNYHVKQTLHRCNRTSYCCRQIHTRQLFQQHSILKFSVLKILLLFLQHVSDQLWKYKFDSHELVIFSRIIHNINLKEWCSPEILIFFLFNITMSFEQLKIKILRWIVTTANCTSQN